MSSWMSSSKPHPTELVIYPTSHPLCTQHVRIRSGFVGSLSPSKSFESGSLSRTRTQKSCVILFDTFQHQTKRPLLPKLKIYPLWLLMVKATCKIQMVRSGNTNTYIPRSNLWLCMAYTTTVLSWWNSLFPIQLHKLMQRDICNEFGLMVWLKPASVISFYIVIMSII